jgi:serine/threonine-protein kinase
MDATLLVALTVGLAGWHFTRLVRSAELPSDGPNHALLRVEAANAHAGMLWFVSLLTYGVVVPGPTRWQARRMFGVATAAALTVLAAGAATGAVAARLPFLFSMAAGFVYTAAAVVVYGTYRVNALSAQVSAARRELAELGQYRLGRRLGAGGMGEVFLAEHRFLKRACAVKRIRPEMAADPAYARRFEREVSAVTRLSHPAAVQVYDYGRSDDGTLYYVMEYLPGLTLDGVVARAGPLPPGRVVFILRQLCGALAEAHGLGLVHRDVKPSNVLLGRVGGRADAAKLLDVGLVAETSSADTKLTAAGGLLGTPAYMSPEQARGGDAGPAADLYAVGGVGYFLLTGRPPFTADHPLALLHAHQTEPLVPPSARAPGVPADVEAVIVRLLAKDPAARFGSAAAAAEALAGCRAVTTWTEADAAAWWAAAGTGS